MTKGGARIGAGRKSEWPSGVSFEDTTTIRVPKYLRGTLMRIARKLDSGQDILKSDYSSGNGLNQQLEMFPAYSLGIFSDEELAARLAISLKTIRHVNSNKSWGFAKYSARKDPQGIGWIEHSYDVVEGQVRYYFKPQL